MGGVPGELVMDQDAHTHEKHTHTDQDVRVIRLQRARQLHHG